MAGAGDITLQTLQSAFAYLTQSAFYATPPSPWITAPSDIASASKETVIGYAEGWRWWQSEWFDNRLYPLSENAGWPWAKIGKETIADVAPAADNTNGLYAYNRKSIVDHGLSLFGRVALYGDVVKHKRGFRAEKARILDLWFEKDVFGQCAEDYLLSLPQTKGTFTRSPLLICDQFGKSFEDYVCLTLENRKELQDTNPSAGPTTSLILKRQPLTGLRVQFQYMSRSLFQANPQPSGQSVWRAPWDRRPWVYEAEGERCAYCGRLLKADDFVVKEFELPENYELMLWKGTFKWKEVIKHGNCVPRFITMGIDTAFGNDGAVYYVWGADV